MASRTSPIRMAAVLALVALLGAPVARANDVDAAVTDAGAANTVAIDYATIGQLRDPFWPLGWTPPPVETFVDTRPEARPKGPVRWDEATRMLELTALTQLPSGKYLAVLKGIGVVETGDKIAVKFGGLIYRWEITSITSEGIVPQRIGVSAPKGN